MLAPPCRLPLAAAVVVLVLELVEEFPALFKGRVLLFVHVDQFLALDEELGASGYTLLGGWVEEGLGERGEAFGVVGYEGGEVALGFEVGGGKAV